MVTHEERTQDASSTSPPGGVLVIRAWGEGRLRARVLGVDEHAGVGPTVAVAEGVDEICSAVRRWLVHCEAALSDAPQP